MQKTFSDVNNEGSFTEIVNQNLEAMIDAEEHTKAWCSYFEKNDWRNCVLESYAGLSKMYTAYAITLYRRYKEIRESPAFYFDDDGEYKLLDHLPSPIEAKKQLSKELAEISIHRKEYEPPQDRHLNNLIHYGEFIFLFPICRKELPTERQYRFISTHVRKELVAERKQFPNVYKNPHAVPSRDIAEKIKDYVSNGMLPEKKIEAKLSASNKMPKNLKKKLDQNVSDVALGKLMCAVDGWNKLSLEEREQTILANRSLMVSYSKKLQTIASELLS